MRDFDFLEPTSVAEASRLLGELGDEVRAMAGGTALMLAMRQRMVVPTHIVSLARIEGLRGVSYDPAHGLRIGALARHCDVGRDEAVRRHYPMLAAMAAQMANPQVRHQGTVGGNLCYADPATDPPSCLLALDAQVVLGSVRGERVLPLADFLVDYYVTALEPDEIVVEVRVPVPAADHAGVYTRYLRTAAEHRPLVNVALAARVSGQAGRDYRLVVGASVTVPGRQARAEAFLEGRVVTPEVAAEAAGLVAADIEPLHDHRGSADYRREMVKVVARRAIARLFGLAQD